MFKIGIIKERKSPPDTRVALSPQQCQEITTRYKNIQIVVEPSDLRCFKDEEYQNLNITLTDRMENCDLLLGIKEVPVANLIPNKSYLFFSHTKKKQVYNQALMHALIEKKITMIDYETLVDSQGGRLIAFGYYAGIVGAHNGLLTYGIKTSSYKLRPAHQCEDYNEMIKQYENIVLPNIKIVVTGSGNVSKGIIKVLNDLKIKEVKPADFLKNKYEVAVYTQLKSPDLFERIEDQGYERTEFHHSPTLYQSKFIPYLSQTDIIINGIYWDENVPRLFEKSDINNTVTVKTIADITCDFEGSIPINYGASTVSDPVYGVSKSTLNKMHAFEDKDAIEVMAIDNLPSELPKDSSVFFGRQLLDNILPELLKENSEIVERATICKDGKLTPPFEYLSDYAY